MVMKRNEIKNFMWEVCEVLQVSQLIWDPLCHRHRKWVELVNYTITIQQILLQLSPWGDPVYKTLQQCFFSMDIRLSNYVHYRPKLTATAEPLIKWHNLNRIWNCKLWVLSNECSLDWIRQCINEINHFSALRHWFQHAKWRDRRAARCKYRPLDKLRCPS